ncbi:MAG: late competence development ComFB family protein [candidate division WOR-3 bacterium]
MERKNYTEKLVEEVLERIIKDYPEYSDIEPYKEDVIAFALSKCEPYYTTSDIGHAVIKTRMDSSSFRSKVTAIVLEAIEKVKKNPRK